MTIADFAPGIAALGGVSGRLTRVGRPVAELGRWDMEMLAAPERGDRWRVSAQAFEPDPLRWSAVGPGDSLRAVIRFGLKPDGSPAEWRGTATITSVDPLVFELGEVQRGG
jgi:hypothetical protein